MAEDDVLVTADLFLDVFEEGVLALVDLTPEL